MSWLAADGKTFKKPRRPFEKERLDAELKLVGEYGLRNKRELWRVQMALSKIRQVSCSLEWPPRRATQEIHQLWKAAGSVAAHPEPNILFDKVVRGW